ncbi:hypothetical protein MHU86_12242 [Fragilaria crotonensis]|nr:hypothetical protein MHU86_12242 [Fragilaria crotonensis]
MWQHFRWLQYSNSLLVFCEEAGIDFMSDDTIAMPAGIISDSDEDEEGEEEESSRAQKQCPNTWAPSKRKEKTTEESVTTKPNIIPDEESRQPASEMLQLLALHHQYGHIPMRKLQEMAKQGILLRRLAKCNIPTCSACLFARGATKHPWSGKTRRDTDSD